MQTLEMPILAEFGQVDHGRRIVVSSLDQRACELMMSQNKTFLIDCSGGDPYNTWLDSEVVQAEPEQISPGTIGFNGEER